MKFTLGVALNSSAWLTENLPKRGAFKNLTAIFQDTHTFQKSLYIEI